METKLFLALEKNGNALGLSAMERDKFVTKVGLPIFDGSQEYCLWLGCMGGYDPKGREIIADFARVMDYLGATFGVLKKEKCTGDPARRLGNDLVFGSLAEAGLKALETAKVQKIVAICPHCVRTISNDWRSMGWLRRLSTTRSLWLGIRTVCRNSREGIRSYITIPATWDDIAMCMRSRGRLFRWLARCGGTTVT